MAIATTLYRLTMQADNDGMVAYEAQITHSKDVLATVSSAITLVEQKTLEVVCESGRRTDHDDLAGLEEILRPH